MHVVAEICSWLRRVVAVRVPVLVRPHRPSLRREIVVQQLLHEVGAHVAFAFDRQQGRAAALARCYSRRRC